MSEIDTPERQKAAEVLRIISEVNLLIENNMPELAVQSLLSLKRALTLGDYRGVWVKVQRKAEAIWDSEEKNVPEGALLTNEQIAIRNVWMVINYHYTKEMAPPNQDQTSDDRTI